MIGKELIIDMRGCDGKLLQDVRLLENILTKAVETVNAIILSKKFHKFTGGGRGVTGYILLAESHVSIHTYPEINYAAIDIFACGKLNAETILDNIMKQLPHKTVKIKKISRGN